MPERMFVASGRGTSLVFKINPKGKVIWASPRVPKARGSHLITLRRDMRRAGFAFYEVTRG
jgi:hypothetical protein